MLLRLKNLPIKIVFDSLLVCKLISFKVHMKRICVLLLVMVWFPLAGYPSSINNAYNDYLHGNYEEAVKKAKRLRSSDTVLYFLGLVYMKTRDFDKARVSFNRLVREFPQSRVYESGLVKIADTYFLQGDYPKAKVLYQEIKDKDNSSDFMPLVYLRLAQICSKQGEWDDKNKYLRILRGRYPDSSEIKFADVLDDVGDAFFIQVGAFSSKSNAVGLKSELEKDYPVYIEAEEKSGYTVYKVRVGDFNMRKKAETTASSLTKKGYPARIYP